MEHLFIGDTCEYCAMKKHYEGAKHKCSRALVGKGGSARAEESKQRALVRQKALNLRVLYVLRDGLVDVLKKTVDLELYTDLENALAWTKQDIARQEKSRGKLKGIT